MKTEHKNFSIVFIPTWECNCTCGHCFEKIIPQVIKDEYWNKFFLKMRDLTSKLCIDKLLIYWQGGEVLTMKPANIKKGLKICADIFKDTKCTVEHHLQTNLLLYNSQWKEIISEFFIGSISSSMDFPNIYRTSPQLDQKTYINAWLNKKEEAEKDGFVVSVVTLPNIKTIEIGAKSFYSFFKNDMGIRNLQINFSFPGVNKNIPEQMDRDKLAIFLEQLYNIWVNDKRYINLNPFVPLENRIFKNAGTLSCAWSFSCANFLFAVGPDGEVGQCDCWISTQKTHSFGSLLELSIDEILGSAKRKPFLERPIKMIDDPECGVCEFWQICYGGCPVRAFTFNGDIFSKDYYCPVYRKLFLTILKNGQKDIHKKEISE
ncbi:radical SAM protein [Candidatus Poribacteria bacterium]|nr:radical SAM protein [Candidatus Poribacteria bacterium]